MLRLAFLASLLAAATSLAADRTLAEVWQARDLLGPDTWTRVVRIENARPSVRYPRILHALVFEFAGILWFYTPREGTQSFSLHVNRLEAEKADFAPLLQDIDPGFRRWTVLPERERSTEVSTPAPGNTCFIESIVAIRELVACGAPVQRPRLLSYYSRTRQGVRGHTVALFEIGEKMVVVDRTNPRGKIQVVTPGLEDALAIAKAIAPASVTSARVLEIRPEAAVFSPARTPQCNENVTINPARWHTPTDERFSS